MGSADDIGIELAAVLASDARLDRVLAVLGRLDDPDLVEGDPVGRLDALADEAFPEPGPVPGPEQVLEAVFGQLRFVGNTQRYYDPANSHLHRVIERRRGIPLTLAVVASEIGRRRAVALSIVGMPGHVLLGDGLRPSRWFDPFGGGRVLDIDGCRQLFSAFGPVESFDPSMVQPIDGGAVVDRTLANLRNAHLRLGDLGRLIDVLTVKVAAGRAHPPEHAELAGALAAAGRTEMAAERFEQLIDIDPARGDAHRRAAARLRAHRN